MSGAHSPTTIEGRPDPDTSRWLWLIKWFLMIPHLLALAVLFVGMLISILIALFAITFNGRYPRALFDYNLGVLRWSWRVGFYGYGMLGTDRYPPFTLQPVPDYPATLEIAYPEKLSRGLPWIKWLLLIPHIIILGIIVGSGPIAGGAFTTGLAGLLVLIGAVIYAFTGKRSGGIGELVMGFQRWALRVSAYALLMTDDYPPFRLDQGFQESA
jgi:hypothetical protein